MKKGDEELLKIIRDLVAVSLDEQSGNRNHGARQHRGVVLVRAMKLLDPDYPVKPIYPRSICRLCRTDIA